MTTIALVCYGMPAPQGSKSFKGMRKGKDGKEHAVMAESSKKVKPWRKDVEAAGKDACARYGLTKPLAGPIIARMIFTVPKPQSAPKRRRTYPDRMPDLSKLLRSTEDALTTAGVWEDDARVVEYSRLAKVYPGEDPEALDAPGVRVFVSTIDEDVIR